MEEIVRMGGGVGYSDEDGEGSGTGWGDGGVRGLLRQCGRLRGEVLCWFLHRVTGGTRV